MLLFTQNTQCVCAFDPVLPLGGKEQVCLLLECAPTPAEQGLPTPSLTPCHGARPCAVSRCGGRSREKRSLCLFSQLLQEQGQNLLGSP